MSPSIRGGLTLLLVISAGLLGQASETGAQGRTDASPSASEFLRIAHAELAGAADCPKAAAYFNSLNDAEQLIVARIIIRDSDARIAYMGANVLIQRGYAKEAVPALASMIANGLVETVLNGRFGYEWIHSDDDMLFLRMSVLINRFLLAHLGRYRGEQRIRVERVLMGGMLERSDKAFSRREAERLILEWEARLGPPKSKG